MPRLDPLRSLRYFADANPGLVVEALPLGIDRSGRRAPREQNLDVVAHAGDREGDECGRRADAVARVAEQLVCHEHDPS